MYSDHNRGDRRKVGGVVIFFTVAAILLILSTVWSMAADFGRSSKDIDAGDRPAIGVSIAPVESSWTALWGAALAGYSMSNTELNFDIFGETEGGRETFNVANVNGFGGEGFTGDLQIGGDVQLGRFVVGAFAEYSFGGIESSASVFDNAARLDVEQNDSWSILARLGITSGNSLFYVASGYTETSVEATLRAGDESESREFDFSGIPLELGVEHKFSQNVRGRLAARYTWLDEETVARFGDEEFGGSLTAEPGVWQVKAGVVISTGGLGIFAD